MATLRTLVAHAVWLSCVALLPSGCDDPGAMGDESMGDGAVVDGAPPAAADADPPDADPPDAGPADATTPDAALEGCLTAQRYAPFTSDEVDVFPDDALTRPDPESPTGLRVDLDGVAWPSELPRLVRETIAEMSGLTGFGHNGTIILRFTAPIAPVPDDLNADEASALMLFDLDLGPPTRVPYRVRTADEGATLLIDPVRPLRGGARHGLVLADHLDAEGGCIEPSPALAATLAGAADDPRLDRLTPAYTALLDAAGVTADEVVAATVFTTHREDVILWQIAADIRLAPVLWQSPLDCEDDIGDRACVGVLTVSDFRDPRAVRTIEASGTADVPVRVWLPEGEGPFPLLVVAHGLGADWFEARAVFRRWSDLGYAVAALDAVGHGEHPSAEAVPIEEVVMRFLGLDLGQLKVDGRALTGHFDQTVLERLQLMEALRKRPDIDGDGVADIDTDRIAYYGISLGGMLGAATLVLDPRIELGLMLVPGGGLSQIAIGSGPAAMFLPLVENLAGGPDALARLLPLLQAAIDRADPATWAGLLRAGARPVNILVQLSTHDQIVPPATGLNFVRALELPHVGTVVEPAELIETQSAPATLNGYVGSTTIGFTQYDRVTWGGRVRPSDHNNTPFSPEGELQAFSFVEPWAAGEVPVIIDPYTELETPPLE